MSIAVRHVECRRSHDTSTYSWRSAPAREDPMSKYRIAFLIWLTMVTTVGAAVATIHYSCESCRANEHVYYLQ
jgi:hypothetical protein